MAFVTPLPIFVSRAHPRTSPRRPRRVHAVTVATAAAPAAPTPEPEEEPSNPGPAEGPTTEAPPEPDPLTSLFNAVQKTVNTAATHLLSPLQSLLPPLKRPFTSLSTNQVLYPPSETKPKAVIHFLGAAFFGATPALYTTFLQSLASRGYVIVATPYNLAFDYLPLVEGIVKSWENVESELAFNYGELPVIGIGHSAGAVFQCIAECFFPDAMPRAACVHISWNCRKANDAIPGFETFVSPFSKALISLRESVPSETIQQIEGLPERIEQLVEAGALTPDIVKDSLLPSAKDARTFLDQIRPLLEVMAGEGVREFCPAPEDVVAGVEQLYRVPESLVVTFRGDTLDDGPVLQEAMKMAGVEVSVAELAGSHLTPLVQPPDVEGLSETAAAPLALGLGVVADTIGADVERLVKVIDEWIEAGISNGRI